MSRDVVFYTTWVSNSLVTLCAIYQARYKQYDSKVVCRNSVFNFLFDIIYIHDYAPFPQVVIFLWNLLKTTEC